MDKRIKNDITQIAGIVSSLLLYLDDCERQERERVQRPIFRLLTNEDKDSMVKFKDGSFRRRGKRYEYRFMLDGKQRTVLGDTQAECFLKREQAIRKAGQQDSNEKPVTAREVMTLFSSIQTQPNAAGSSVLFGEWLQRWYMTYKEAQLKAHTRRNYLRHLAELQASPLASVPLNELTGEQLQSYLAAETHSNKRSKIMDLVRPALKKAVALRMLAFNPFDAVEVPKHKNKRRAALTFPQQTTLFANVSGKYESAAWVLCCTGLRIGEFLGLDYTKDVDYTAGTITVRGGADIYTGEYINSPKTENGRRVIRFLSTLIPNLERCATEHFTYNMLRLHFSRLFKKLGLSECSLYTFRHTFVSLCAYVGIPPQYLQQLAGHASIVTTFDVYTDPLEKGESPLLPYFEKLSYFYPKKQ